MKKDRGFSYIEIILSMMIILGISYLSVFYYAKLEEKRDIEKAKNIILTIFSEYTAQAFDEESNFNVKIEHSKKRITVFYLINRIKKIENLPRKLKYSSVFDNSQVEEIEIKITKNGNITPSFSFYIFGYDDIAKYRISFYGFQKIHFLKINVYKNISDKKWTYQNLMLYHKHFNVDSNKWRVE